MLCERQYSYLRIMMWLDSLLAALGLLLAYLLRYLLAGFCAAHASSLPAFVPLMVPYEEGYFLGELLWTLPACMLAYPLCLGHAGFYSSDGQQGGKGRFGLVLKGCFLAVAALVILIFVFKLEYTARTVVIGSGFLTAGLLCIKELYLRRHPVFRASRDDFHVLFLVKGEEPEETAAIKERYESWGAKIEERADFDALDEKEFLRTLIDGRIDELACFCKEEDLSQVWPRLKPAGKLGLRISCYYRPEGGMDNLSFERAGGLGLLSQNKTSVDFGALTLKMILDRVLALLLLVLLSPVFLVVAFLVKRESQGPAFYRQERVGRNGHTFTLLKFRSMTADAEQKLGELEGENQVEGWAFKMDRDPRVTKVGAVIRRYSIDELPQLINVLKGDMSLVGPRPALPREVEAFNPGERRRLSMKPGMTGLWQVSGRHTLPIERWIELDLQYIDNWRLGLDFSILVRTIATVLRGEGR